MSLINYPTIDFTAFCARHLRHEQLHNQNMSLLEILLILEVRYNAFMRESDQRKAHYGMPMHPSHAHFHPAHPPLPPHPPHPAHPPSHNNMKPSESLYPTLNQFSVQSHKGDDSVSSQRDSGKDVEDREKKVKKSTPSNGHREFAKAIWNDIDIEDVLEKHRKINYLWQTLPDSERAKYQSTD